LNFTNLYLEHKKIYKANILHLQSSISLSREKDLLSHKSSTDALDYKITSQSNIFNSNILNNSNNLLNSNSQLPSSCNLKSNIHQINSNNRRQSNNYSMVKHSVTNLEIINKVENGPLSPTSNYQNYLADTEGIKKLKIIKKSLATNLSKVPNNFNIQLEIEENQSTITDKKRQSKITDRTHNNHNTSHSTKSINRVKSMERSYKDNSTSLINTSSNFNTNKNNNLEKKAKNICLISPVNSAQSNLKANMLNGQKTNSQKSNKPNLLKSAVGKIVGTQVSKETKSKSNQDKKNYIFKAKYSKPSIESDKGGEKVFINKFMEKMINLNLNSKNPVSPAKNSILNIK